MNILTVFCHCYLAQTTGKWVHLCWNLEIYVNLCLARQHWHGYFLIIIILWSLSTTTIYCLNNINRNEKLTLTCLIPLIWCAADQAALWWCINVCFILDCASMRRLNTPRMRRKAVEVFPSSPPDLSQQDSKAAPCWAFCSLWEIETD